MMSGKRIVFTGGSGKAGRHVVPWLKQRGYEIARNLGDQAAIWAAEPRGPQPVLALRCRTGHALAIVTA